MRAEGPVLASEGLSGLLCPLPDTLCLGQNEKLGQLPLSLLVTPGSTYDFMTSWGLPDLLIWKGFLEVLGGAEAGTLIWSGVTPLGPEPIVRMGRP